MLNKTKIPPRRPAPPPEPEEETEILDQEDSDIAYGTWGDEGLKADRKAIDDSKGDGGVLEEGENVVRFMPPKRGAASPFMSVYKHYVDKPGGDGRMGIVCPRKMANQRCPICEQAFELDASPHEADRKLAKGLWPKMRVYAYGVNMDEDEDTRHVRLYELPKTVYDGLVTIRESKRGGDFSHPETGWDILIMREGKGPNTKYPSVASSLEGRTPLDNPEYLSQLSAMPSLEAKKALPSREQMAEFLEILDSTFGRAPAAALDVTPRSKAQALPKPAPKPLPKPAAAPSMKRRMADLVEEPEELEAESYVGPGDDDIPY